MQESVSCFHRWDKMQAMKDLRLIHVHLTHLLIFVILILVGCERPDPEVTIVASPGAYTLPPTPLVTPRPGERPVLPATVPPQPSSSPQPTYIGVPTPDPPHSGGNGDGQSFISHNVGIGETLGYIAQLYGSSIEELQTANQLAETDLLYVGQVLQIPTQSEQFGLSFKIIPDSELVYGPAAKEFDVRAYLMPSQLLTHPGQPAQMRAWSAPRWVRR